ncbi:MAG: hypothetical protein ACJA0U_002924 [Salibacteraceae bacterium]|jgi:uncharacterized protein YkwD
MKNLTSLLAIICISFVTVAADRPYNRLDRLYNSDPARCLKVSKRYIKYLPDNAVPFYFASIVYRDKSRVHLSIKTRYLMMSKSIGYAMKFEDFDDTDLEIKLGWESYLEELQNDTNMLIKELEQTEIARLGDRLAIKHQKMVNNREIILLVSGGTNDNQITVPGGNNSEVESEKEVVESDNSEKKGYYGLASGNEITPSYNKIQERELFNMINEERKALFMSPLKLDDGLNQAARYHAFDMATQNYFYEESYDRIDGELVLVSGAKTRIGQFHPKQHILSQNIAAGSTNAIETFNQWMEYDEQYDVLFDESSKKVGIGIFYDSSSSSGYYWVLVTAKR